ncbi:hypothetical protein GHT06_010458 [Daphnia sinensis]|uniref:Uncharacterized protein n=1 Tax=Daphnia sinensis TaxID=1820382 RepID=A0AAD5L122_9CRUS|nr:hypothetical protein GHT06_010458 [Daphnia sinensis]
MVFNFTPAPVVLGLAMFCHCGGQHSTWYRSGTFSVPTAKFNISISVATIAEDLVSFKTEEGGKAIYSWNEFGLKWHCPANQLPLRCACDSTPKITSGVITGILVWIHQLKKRGHWCRADSMRTDSCPCGISD